MKELGHRTLLGDQVLGTFCNIESFLLIGLLVQDE